jgi:hypothetical protein
MRTVRLMIIRFVGMLIIVYCAERLFHSWHNQWMVLLGISLSGVVMLYLTDLVEIAVKRRH